VDPHSQAANTEIIVNTTNETTTDLPAQSSQRIGIVVIIIIATVSVVTVVIALAILLKKCHAVPTATNQAYGLNTHKGVEESIYKFPGPEMNVDNKQTVAYVTNFNTDATVEVNEAYRTRIVTDENEAYATSITTEGNQAYATTGIYEIVD
jgi:flagellar basal body-associated protein FliL